MDFRPKSRQRKLLEAVYPFFGDIASNYHEDQSVRVCRHLRTLGDQVLLDEWLKPLIEVWDSQHPEENMFSAGELQWALQLFDENVTEQLAQLHKKQAAAKLPRARFRVINGGLHENPDIPYVDPTRVVHEYDF